MEAKLDIKDKMKKKWQCFIQLEQHKPEKGQCLARRRQNKEEEKTIEWRNGNGSARQSYQFLHFTRLQE